MTFFASDLNVPAPSKWNNQTTNSTITLFGLVKCAWSDIERTETYAQKKGWDFPVNRLIFANLNKNSDILTKTRKNWSKNKKSFSGISMKERCKKQILDYFFFRYRNFRWDLSEINLSKGTKKSQPFCSVCYTAKNHCSLYLIENGHKTYLKFTSTNINCKYSDHFILLFSFPTLLISSSALFRISISISKYSSICISRNQYNPHHFEMVSPNSRDFIILQWITD